MNGGNEEISGIADEAKEIVGDQWEEASTKEWIRLLIMAAKRAGGGHGHRAKRAQGKTGIGQNGHQAKRGMG
ncbi:hypothetical protein Tco_1472710 [Tanacetum coccineum]